MTLNQIQQEILALPEWQQIILLRRLLQNLPQAGTDVSDEEITIRERELESDQVEPLSHEEFVRRVQARHGR